MTSLSLPMTVTGTSKRNDDDATIAPTLSMPASDVDDDKTSITSSNDFNRDEVRNNLMLTNST